MHSPFCTYVLYKQILRSFETSNHLELTFMQRRMVHGISLKVHDQKNHGNGVTPSFAPRAVFLGAEKLSQPFEDPGWWEGSHGPLQSSEKKQMETFASRDLTCPYISHFKGRWEDNFNILHRWDLFQNYVSFWRWFSFVIVVYQRCFVLNWTHRISNFNMEIPHRPNHHNYCWILTYSFQNTRGWW